MLRSFLLAALVAPSLIAAPARAAGLARTGAVSAAPGLLDARAGSLDLQAESAACLGCHPRHRLLTPSAPRFPSRPLALSRDRAQPYSGAGLAILPSHPLEVALPVAPDYRSPPFDADGRPQLALPVSTATGGTVTSLVDAAAIFPDIAGATVFFTSGANAGLSRVVVSASPTELSFDALPSAIEPGTGYRLDSSGDLGDNLLLNDGGALTYTRGTLVCLSCHRDHRSAAAAGSSVRRAGDGLCTGCHVLQTHSSATVGTRYGTWGEGFTCGTCHQPHEATNAALVRSPISGPDGQARPVRLVAASGPGSFADGDAVRDGVCEVCHSRTTHFRRDGSGADPLHANFGLEAGADCRTCHSHRLGFRASCAGCHMPTPATQSWPGGAGAHAKHVQGLGYACVICHSAARHNEGAGVIARANVDVQFGSRSFAAGTTIDNGGAPTERDKGGVPTCYVGCHNPVVATPVGEVPNLALGIGWTEPGPLACTRCHDTHGAELAAARAGHPIDRSTPAIERVQCQGCHDSSTHTSGVVRVKTGAGQSIALGAPGSDSSPLCFGCHDGDGGPPLGGKLPSSAEGFYNGQDWHGTRVGSGSGGTLRPPYVRGQGPITCSACHDAHATRNPYLLSNVVNGRAVTITDRGGRGAETLCGACHDGDFHGSCRSCHAAPGPYASGTCFTCHNHLGIVNFIDPNADCDHCHGGGTTGYSYPDSVAPSIGSVAANAAETTADISWYTSEPATAVVDYGVSSSSMVSSRPTSYLLTSRVIRLTGLQRLTTYQFVVRSSDPYGNEARASGSFTTR